MNQTNQKQQNNVKRPTSQHTAPTKRDWGIPALAPKEKQFGSHYSHVHMRQS